MELRHLLHHGWVDEIGRDVVDNEEELVGPVV